MTTFKNYVKLYNAVDRGDWEATKAFLHSDEGAIRDVISHSGKTALHFAVAAGHIKIVEEMVKLMEPPDLELVENDGYTPLAIAARGGTTKIAKILLDKNINLVNIQTKFQELPDLLASGTGHADTTRYLYSQTPSEELAPERGKNGVTLLTNCILADIYGCCFGPT